MPDEIRQEMGFDATQTLSALAQLEAAFGKFGDALRGAGNSINALNQAGAKLDEGLKSHANMAREVARVFEQTRTPQEQYAAQMSKLNTMLNSGAIGQETFGRAANQAAQALDNAGKSAHGLMISWQTLARVVVTQAIVRAMSEMRDVIKESYEAFLKFSKQVGEIRAIDPSRSFGRIADDVRRMSDAFNQPLARVAEGQYQTLSNQFTTAADRVNILTAANALAKVTAQDLGDSVLLLTGTLNAYGESSETAGIRAAQFDKTIELGRLRMGELGTAMGRVQTIGHELGVSMEELQAALVSLTIGGLKPSEAATQLRGLMMGLIKPTEELQAAFRKLGVEGPEAAIATFGLQGTVAKLQTVTDGSVQAMGKLFANMRGMAGALRLGDTGATAFLDALEKINQVNMDSLNKKLKEFTSTDAEKLTAELNKIGNFFKVEFGQEMVKSLRILIDVLGGSGGAIRSFGLLAEAIGKVVFAAALFPAAFLRGVDAIRGWMDSNVAALAQQQALRESVEKQIALADTRAGAEIVAANRSNTEIMRLLSQQVSEKGKLYLEDLSNFQRAVKLAEKMVMDSLAKAGQAREKMVRDLEVVSEQAAKTASEIPEKIAEIQARIADRTFNAAMGGRDPEEQFRRYLQMGRELGDQAAAALGSAKDPEQAKAAEATRKRAEAMLSAADSVAKQSKDTDLIRKSTYALNALDEQHGEALKSQEQTLNRVSEQTAAIAQQARLANEQLDAQKLAIQDSLKTLVEDIKKGANSQVLGKDLLHYQDLTEGYKKSFTDATKQFGDQIKAIDPKAFQPLQREVAKAIKAGGVLDTIVLSPQAIASMIDEVQSTLGNLRGEIPVILRMEEATGKSVIGGFSALAKAFEKMLSDATETGIKAGTAKAKLAIDEPLFKKSLEGLGGGALEARGRQVTEKVVQGPFGLTAVAQEISEGFSSTQVANRNAVNSGVVLMKALKDGATLTEAEWENLNRILSITPEELGLSGTAAARYNESIKALLPMMERWKKAKEDINHADSDTENKRRLDSINEAIGSTNREKEAQKGVVVQIDDATRAAMAVKTAISDGTTVTNSQLMATVELGRGWDSVAAKARQAAMAAAGVSSPGAGGDFSGAGDFGGDSGSGGDFSLGGLIRYFDRGGHARRGTDVIPAMLSPGEFIMSARATRRFYSQLVAMNAGHQPVHRASGGPITNAGIVGDVTVNVGSGSKNTGREVIRAINREIRRGTGRLYS